MRLLAAPQLWVVLRHGLLFSSQGNNAWVEVFDLHVKCLVGCNAPGNYNAFALRLLLSAPSFSMRTETGPGNPVAETARHPASRAMNKAAVLEPHISSAYL
jgi:hypothetical protein